MTQLLGLMGYPLKHSISPAFQQAALDHYGLDIRYEAWETEPERVREVVERLRQPTYLGMNVTVPYKEVVIPMLDAIDTLARGIRAVNTIVNTRGLLKGYNTDAPGFLLALEKDGGFQPKGKTVVLLGAGGAARAVSFALVGAGVAELTVLNRTVGRAQALIEDVRKAFAGTGSNPALLASPLDGDDADKALYKCDLIVNCTSMGMLHSSGEGQSPIKVGLIPKGALVFDLVYNPSETPLLKQAKEAGASVLGGLPMLVYQGAAAFEVWIGRESPVRVMFEAATGALRDRERV